MLKNYKFISLVVISLLNNISVNLYSMQISAEERLLAHQITAQKYLLEIEQGLYGLPIAAKMNVLASVEYDQYAHVYDPGTQQNIKNLYQLLIGTIEFAAKRGTNFTPEAIKKLAITQIQAKFQLLSYYYSQGLIDIPNDSGVGESPVQVARVSGQGK